jgi:hypothetical protein
MDEVEIKEKLTSDSLEVLQQALDFVDGKIDVERERANRAERRAIAFLAITGVLSGFTVHFAKIISSPEVTNKLPLYCLYIGAVIFVLRAAYNAVKAQWAMKTYELTPGLVFELQAFSGENAEKDAVREIVAMKIWEYYQLIPIGSARHYFTNRSQVNILATIICFGSLGLLWILQESLKFELPPLGGVLILIAVLLSIFTLHTFVEKGGKTWHYQPYEVAVKKKSPKK